MVPRAQGGGGGPRGASEAALTSSSVTVGDEEGRGPGQVTQASFIYSTLFQGPSETEAPRGSSERALCLCTQAFQGLLQKVGALGALKGFLSTAVWLGVEGRARARGSLRPRACAPFDSSKLLLGTNSVVWGCRGALCLDPLDLL